MNQRTNYVLFLFSFVSFFPIVRFSSLISNTRINCLNFLFVVVSFCFSFLFVCFCLFKLSFCIELHSGDVGLTYHRCYSSQSASRYEGEA